MTTAASTRTSGFHPVFKEAAIDGVDHFPAGWYIGCSDRPERWFAGEGNDILCFGRRSDCERAIAAFTAEGVFDDADMDAVSDFDFVRICCQNLAW